MVLPCPRRGRPAVVALIAGWVTTEVERQPWVVYGHMRTEAAVTGASGIPVGYTSLLLVAAGDGGTGTAGEGLAVA